MKQGDAPSQVGEDLSLQLLELLGRRSDAQLVALLDQRTEDENLPARGHLFAHERVGIVPPVRRNQARHHRPASGRHLVEDGDVEVAVEREAEGSRDGGRRHR